MHCPCGTIVASPGKSMHVPGTADHHYDSILSLQRDLARCRRCAEAGFRIESAPVVHGAAGRRAYLYGQAPGVVEGDEGAPLRGRAGRTLRRWLELDEEAFYGTFYCASVTRCYPGRATGRGDRTPTPAEQRLCSTWLVEELRLLEPDLLITVGGLAARAIVGARTLAECVGKSYLIGESVAIPLPHPSGGERVAERPGQPEPAGEGAHPRAAGDRQARRDPC